MCQFLETIKYEDGKFFYLNYHQQRVNRTFANFYIEKKAFDLEEALENENKPKQGLYRCRVIYNSTIQKIEFIEQKPRDINTLKVVHCESIDYSYKIP
jgi:4-amino-4-deoxychorismate lyase